MRHSVVIWGEGANDGGLKAPSEAQRREVPEHLGEGSGRGVRSPAGCRPLRRFHTFLGTATSPVTVGGGGRGTARGRRKAKCSDFVLIGRTKGMLN